MILTIDFETRSPVDLRETGVHVYVEHPATDILMCAFKVDDQEPVIWFPEWACKIIGSTSLPVINLDQVHYLIEEADEIHAHNAPFEIAMWRGVATPRYGWPVLPTHKIRCTMARSFMAGLPGSLDGAINALGLPIKKDAEGHRLMLKMCKPRRVNKADREKWLGGGDLTSELLVEQDNHFYLPEHDERIYMWHEEPAQIARLAEYCLQDVEAEHALSKELPELPPSELELWRLDQRINNRGFAVAVDDAEMFVQRLEAHKEKVAANCTKLTGISPTQVGAASEWMRAMGLKFEDLTAESVKTLLKMDDLPTLARVWLEARQSVGKTSNAKFQAFVDATCADGRLRASLQYHAATTGRWGGRLVQPHNLPRPKFKDADDAIATLREDPELFEALWGDPMVAASSCVRAMVKARDGWTLAVCDFSSIEARVVAWLAGEEHVLAAFRDKLDLYKVAATAIYGVEYGDVTKDQRQIGKVAVLALGYQGAEGAFQQMAAGYGLKVEDEVARDIIKNWRSGHPNIVVFWREMQVAAIEAIETGKTAWAGNKVAFEIWGRWLRMVLPSGRRLYYLDPRISEEPYWEFPVAVPDTTVEGGWRDDVVRVVKAKDLAGAMKALDKMKKTKGVVSNGPWREKVRKTIVFRGYDSMTKQFGKTATYGGKLVENCWAAGTLILTERGVVPIETVVAGDRVWDGVEWVTTQGVVFQGEKEVGEWLGTQVTGDHKILVGDSWKEVMLLDDRLTRESLSQGRALAPLSWSNLEEGTASPPSACATAAKITRSTPGHCFVGRRSDVEHAATPKLGNQEPPNADTGKSSPKRGCCLCGCTDTQGSSPAAMTPSTKHIATTGAGGSGSPMLGEATSGLSFDTPSPSPDGMISNSKSTESTTTGGTNRGTSDLCPAQKTPGIDGAMSGYLFEEEKSQSPNSGKAIAPVGGPSTPSIITSEKGEHSTRSWKSTGKVVPVYDLIDCGPRNRFTVVTPYGPIIAHNCVQAVARDLLAAAMIQAEKAAHIVLHVHDEIVCEAPESEGVEVLHALEEIMSAGPSWADGLPLGAEGYVAKRYSK